MSTIIGIFTIALAVILQTTIIVEMQLLQGTADLVLLTLLGWILQEESEGHWQWGIIAGLFVGIASELPIWLTVMSYLIVVFIVRLLHSRIWQAPMVIMFVSITISSFVLLLIDAIYLLIIGVPLPLMDSINLVILPSVLLNLLFLLPVYALVGELVKAVIPVGGDG